MMACLTNQTTTSFWSSPPCTFSSFIVPQVPFFSKSPFGSKPKCRNLLGKNQEMDKGNAAFPALSLSTFVSILPHTIQESNAFRKAEVRLRTGSQCVERWKQRDKFMRNKDEPLISCRHFSNFESCIDRGWWQKGKGTEKRDTAFIIILRE